MKKLLLSLFLISSLGLSAQTNVVKLNLMGLGLGNFSFQYERTITEHSSVCLGLSFLPSRGLPTVVLNQDSSGDLKFIAFSGWSITPEYRYYFTGKAPKGFYIAPYFRHSSYSIEKLGIQYTNQTTNENKTAFVDGKYTASTVGLMFGAQWLLGEHFTLDWWIIGAGFGSQKATISGSGNFDPSEQQDIRDNIAQLDKDFPGTLTYTVTSNSLSVDYKYNLPAIRAFGLCLGYKF